MPRLLGVDGIYERMSGEPGTPHRCMWQFGQERAPWWHLFEMRPPPEPVLMPERPDNPPT